MQILVHIISSLFSRLRPAPRTAARPVQPQQVVVRRRRDEDAQTNGPAAKDPATEEDHTTGADQSDPFVGLGGAQPIGQQPGAAELTPEARDYWMLVQGGVLPPNQMRNRLIDGQQVYATARQFRHDAHGVPLIQEIEAAIFLTDGHHTSDDLPLWQCPHCGNLVVVSSQITCESRSCRQPLGCPNCTVRHRGQMVHVDHLLTTKLQRLWSRL